MAARDSQKGRRIAMDAEGLKKCLLTLIEKSNNVERLELLCRLAKKILG